MKPVRHDLLLARFQYIPRRQFAETAIRLISLRLLSSRELNTIDVAMPERTKMEDELFLLLNLSPMTNQKQQTKNGDLREVSIQHPVVVVGETLLTRQ